MSKDIFVLSMPYSNGENVVGAFLQRSVAEAAGENTARDYSLEGEYKVKRVTLYESAADYLASCDWKIETGWSEADRLNEIRKEALEKALE